MYKEAGIRWDSATVTSETRGAYYQVVGEVEDLTNHGRTSL